MPQKLIHSTAIIGNKVELGSNVKIGPYSVIEDNVQIGNNSNIKNFVTICKNTIIGKDCEIFHNCSIGEIPQDLKFNNEKILGGSVLKKTIDSFVVQRIFDVILFVHPPHN